MCLMHNLLSAGSIIHESQLVLGYTLLYFVAILVVLAYGEPTTLPATTVNVWGQDWPAYVFAIAGILGVLSSGLFVACLR